MSAMKKELLRDLTAGNGDYWELFWKLVITKGKFLNLIKCTYIKKIKVILRLDVKPWNIFRCDAVR